MLFWSGIWSGNFPGKIKKWVELDWICAQCSVLGEDFLLALRASPCRGLSAKFCVSHLRFSCPWAFRKQSLGMWHMDTCNLVDNSQHFGGSYSFRIQSSRVLLCWIRGRKVSLKRCHLPTNMQGITSKRANFIRILCVLFHIPLGLRTQIRFEYLHSASFIKTYHLSCLFNIMKNIVKCFSD
jgi:hypothetical protein